MVKRVAVCGAALVLVLAGAHVASAKPPASSPACDLVPFLCQGGNPGHSGNPGNPGHPAPAPLLAAGIPAFAALGGGALVARLLRRRKAQS